MSNLSRRDFGKKVSIGALAGVAASSAAPLATPQGADSPKRMTTVLREMIKNPGIIDTAGAYDPISARIAESVGFRCIAMGGYSVGSSLCVPEPILTLEDIAEVTRRMTAAVNVPVVVDAGGGYGEPAQVVIIVDRLNALGPPVSTSTIKFIQNAFTIIWALSIQFHSTRC